MDIFKKITELSAEGKPVVLATVISASGSTPAKPGFRMAVAGINNLIGSIGGGALEKAFVDEALQILSGEERLTAPIIRTVDLSGLGMECGGKVEMMIEFFSGGREFFLFGGGHVGRALAPILEQLGYSVTIFDNRPEVKMLAASSGRASGSRKVIIGDYNNISSIAEKISISGGCFIATHGHQWDKAVLAQIIKTAPGLPYIGLIGSKTKVKATLEQLIDEELNIPASLYSPVGLRIGGDSAAEIAVSIAAEIIAVNNGTEVPHMRLSAKAGEAQ